MKAKDLDRQFDKGEDISRHLNLTHARRVNRGQRRVNVSSQIEKADVQNALAESVWDFGNNVLYRLCEEYPEHNSPTLIVAKIWLIGRSYAAAIERRRNATGSSDDFYERTVAPTVLKSKLGDWLARLPDRLENPWRDLRSVVAIHKRLTDVFSGITGLAKRSLASKYLHFHRPDLFFIYDARAARAISKVTPSIRRVPEIKCREADTEYLMFVRRCQWLHEDVLERFRVNLTPRQVDKILLRVARK